MSLRLIRKPGLQNFGAAHLAGFAEEKAPLSFNVRFRAAFNLSGSAIGLDSTRQRVRQCAYKRHGGLYGTTGSESRDHCSRNRSGDRIAANTWTARRERPSRVASVRQDPNSGRSRRAVF